MLKLVSSLSIFLLEPFLRQIRRIFVSPIPVTFTDFAGDLTQSTLLRCPQTRSVLVLKKRPITKIGALIKK